MTTILILLGIVLFSIFYLLIRTFEKIWAMQKINQKKTVEYLKAFYPDIRNDIANLSDRINFAGIMQTTVDHIKNLLEQTKIQSVIRNVKRMNWIYNRGNSYVRYLIENIFIRSFESLKRKTNPQQWRFLYQEIPADFKTIYLEQTRKDHQLINRSWSHYSLLPLPSLAT